MDSMSKLLRFAQANKHVQDSLEIIEKSLSTYKLESTCISFNGGKDCTAILHLVHSVSKRLSGNNGLKLKAFYAKLPHHFEEENAFVAATMERYNLELMQYSTSSLKESLCKLKEDDPSIEAIFIGTRNDDLKPGISLQTFAKTDHDWPQFMRINPILNWSYAQVWSFIKELDLHYCDLYNQGYSSIGTKKDTAKNPNLVRYHEDGTSFYLPAWRLVKSIDERVSRSSSLEVENKEAR